MNTLDDFTLVIPTHNRPDKFECLVNFLSKYTKKINIIFLDSSDDKIKNKNKKLIISLFRKNINYSYYEFSPTCEPFEKFYFGISKVDTNYCSMCADDDVVLLECIERIVDFLNVNADFTAAHGYYFSFQFDKNDVEIQDVVYYQNNLYQEERMKRVKELFSNYEATFYATYRTQIIKDFFVLAKAVDTSLWKELILALASVMSGKIYRIPSFYYGRSVDESLPFNNWHPHEIFSKNPNLYFTDYLKCRSAVFRYFCVNSCEEEKLFDLSHLFYLEKYLDPKRLDAFCNETFHESHSKEGNFYKTKQLQSKLLQKKYKERKVTQHKLRLTISLMFRESLLTLGYKIVKRFGFLKSIMKKIGIYLFPNVIVTNDTENSSSVRYNFGSEFFLRNLSSGCRPNQKDIDTIVLNMDKYILKPKNNQLQPAKAGGLNERLQSGLKG